MKNNPPDYTPKRVPSKNGFWYGNNKENWTQYEGPYRFDLGGMITVEYLNPPRLPNNQPDLLSCKTQWYVFKGVI